MVRLISIVGEIVVIVGVVSVCSASPASRATSRKLTEADNGGQLKGQRGDRFAVALAGNPTTGYQWEVAHADTAIVKQIGEAQFAPSSTAIGAGGTFTLQFQAVGAGQTKLTLVYRRPFEQQTPPAQGFEVTVVVN